MLARLQRYTLLLSTALACLWVVLGDAFGWRWGGIALAVLTFGWPVLVIGLECLWFLPRANRGDAAPASTLGQRLRAWALESRFWLQVFVWRQPFRSQAIADVPAPLGAPPDRGPPAVPGRRGVVLVHGFVCNRGFWNPWLAWLRADGIPVVAVNLEPIFGGIDEVVPHVARAVATLTQRTGVPPLVVAHSMGGLAVRAWLRTERQAGRTPVAHVVTVGSPHHGTVLAHFSQVPNGKQMRPGSAWLRALASSEPPGFGRRFTCVYGHCDNVVMPTSSAVLREAQTLHIEGTPHVALAFHPATEALVRRLLQDEPVTAPAESVSDAPAPPPVPRP